MTSPRRSARRRRVARLAIGLWAGQCLIAAAILLAGNVVHADHCQDDIFDAAD